MHDTALELGRLFFDRYLPKEGPLTVLDIGSMDVNGSLRSVLPPDRDILYSGVDIAKGPGVDFVIEDPGALPFEDGHFDAVVSTSCLEHDPCFWATVDEAVRVCKPGGFVYLNAPSNGQYHCHPIDCWRFYPDAGLALALWTNRGLRIPRAELVESFVFERMGCEWNDTVIVFGKRPESGALVLPEPLSRLDGAKNIRRHGREGVGRFEQYSEDQRIGMALGISAHHLMTAARADVQFAVESERRPLISVIVAYDQSLHDDATFERCIRSIEAGDAVSVTVMHDGPLLKPVPEVPGVKTFSIHPSSERTGSNGHDGRAQALRFVRGVFVLHTNADGFYHPGALAELSAQLRAEPVGVLVTHVDWRKPDGSIERVSGDPLTKAPALLMQVVLRRGIAHRYGFPGRHVGAEAELYEQIGAEVGYCRSPLVLGEHS